MAKIRKQHIIAVIAVALAIAAIFALKSNEITGAFGFSAITSGRLTYPNGTTAMVFYDNYSGTYVDNSVDNANVYAELCSGDPTNDLLNNYLSLYISVGVNDLNIGVIPVQMTASTINGTGCAVVDADLSLFTSFYPAIISFGVSNNSNMTDVGFYNLTYATGFLKGNFTIDPIIETPTDLTINVRYPLDEDNNTYQISYQHNKSFIVGVRNSSYDVIDSEITIFNNPVTLNRPNGTYIITINNIDNPGIFAPIVHIVTPTPGQTFPPGSIVLITVNATGNITQVLINITWDSTSQLLNSTYNNATGLWEVPFIDTSFIGTYNVTAFGYDANGNFGNDTTYFFVKSGGGGPGGGSGGRGISGPYATNITNETKIPETPKTTEKKKPTVPAEIAFERPYSFDKVFAVFQGQPLNWICFIIFVLTGALLGLLLIHVFFRAINKYFYKNTNTSNGLLIWIIIIALLFTLLLDKTMCGTSSLLLMVLILSTILLLILKMLFSQFKPAKLNEEPIMSLDEIKTMFKTTKHKKRKRK